MMSPSIKYFYIFSSNKGLVNVHEDKNLASLDNTQAHKLPQMKSQYKRIVKHLNSCENNFEICIIFDSGKLEHQKGEVSGLGTSLPQYLPLIYKKQI